MPFSPGSSQSQDVDQPWTYIVSKSNRRKRRHNDAINFHGPPAPPSTRCTIATPVAGAVDGLARGISASISTAHIETAHARATARWQMQPSYQSLAALVSTNASAHAAITQAICLGAGSFGGPLDAGESIRRAHIQTAAVLLVVELLEKHNGRPIKCIFQEPLYTDTDKDYIRGLGHSIAEAPTAIQMITSETLVFAIHLPTREYLDCLTGALPAMLIGTAYRTYEELPQFSNNKASRALSKLRMVHHAFHEFSFPRESHDHCFSDTSIYWRPR